MPDTTEPTTTTLCSRCDATVPYADVLELDGESCCRDCVLACEECGGIILIADSIEGVTGARPETQTVCSECVTYCIDCGEYVVNGSPRSDGGDRPDGNWVCERCYREYEFCNECGHVAEPDSLAYGGLCESCSESASDEQDENGLFPYAYKPPPLFWQVGPNGLTCSADAKATDRTLFFGVENEMEHSRRGESIATFSAAAIVGESGVFYAKYDGSLDDGLEAVSHPATIEAWRLIDPPFAQLQRAGWSAYNTDTCGMHVHITRSAVSRLTLFKLLRFFSKNADFVAWISRRKPTNLDRWAKVEIYPVRLAVQSAIRPPNHAHRHVAINLLNRDTIEIRIFRATLDEGAYKRNIEFVNALLAYLPFASHTTGLTCRGFIEWLASPRTDRAIGPPAREALLTWVKKYEEKS